jgi:DNA modification methylase
MKNWLNQCHFGDCLEILRQMPDGIVQTCVTSPPYFGLRDYKGGTAEIGKEKTPDEFVAALVAVFREVCRVLRDDGTLWLNIGDSYASNLASGGVRVPRSGDRIPGTHQSTPAGKYARPPGLKAKDLIGIPWMLAFALRADGWYLRQEIIWAKPNPMPESVADRCTKSHESIFLLAKSEKYYFDAGAIKEPAAPSSIQRWSQDLEQQAGSDRVPGKSNGNMKAVGGARSKRDSFARTTATEGVPGAQSQHRADREDVSYSETRNKRNVWTVATTPYKGAHFATFPVALIEPCILAGTPAGGVVIDPFFGSGTTGQVAQQLGRKFIGCELNQDYKALQDERLRQPSLMLESA